MGWPVALALLVAGLLIGQIWARRSRRLWGMGSARPGLAFGAVAALIAALATGVRGLWPEALVLLVLAALLVAVARVRALGARRSEAPATVRRSEMSVEEAAALLGVAADASPETVAAAYRRLIRIGHPDQGGTAGLAAQLTEAREVLLRRR